MPTESDQLAPRRSSPLPPLFVTPLEAGQLLGISRTEVYKLLGEGRLAGRRHGKRWLVSYAAVLVFAESLPA